MEVEDCVRGICDLMEMNVAGPVTLGPDEAITMGDFVDLIAEIAEVSIKKVYNPDKPVGVQHRRFDHSLCMELLGWVPDTPIRDGIAKMYHWIEGLVEEGL
jgi:UDP-glucuronate decarboxylase